MNIFCKIWSLKKNSRARASSEITSEWPRLVSKHTYWLAVAELNFSRNSIVEIVYDCCYCRYCCCSCFCCCCCSWWWRYWCKWWILCDLNVCVRPSRRNDKNEDWCKKFLLAVFMGNQISRAKCKSWNGWRARNVNYIPPLRDACVGKKSKASFVADPAVIAAAAAYTPSSRRRRRHHH